MGTSHQIYTYDELLDENERLKGIIKGLKFQLGIRESLLSFHGSNMASATADLIINPNPIEVHATEKGKGIDFMISLKNVLVIESNKRIKAIYVDQPIIPKEGGKSYLKIETNESFDQLLLLLQLNAHHILQISISHAINIHNYEFTESNSFVLIAKPPVGFPEELKKIKTDQKFDHQLYHQRLMEIDRLSKTHHDFSINTKLIEYISRYKNP